MNLQEKEKHDQFLRLYVETEGSLRGFVRSLVPSLEDAKEVMQGTATVSVSYTHLRAHET